MNIKMAVTIILLELTLFEIHQSQKLSELFNFLPYLKGLHVEL